ncbi:MAG: tRNA (N6-threonylcarbamoyladenosine(37)-N6)-methyltransferase TrmO [Rhodobacteraceae bacterium]|nr:tRNA (N6-threonylcarbamoyladenosine(37)-N6)-methyltransferase TrmO [Paracoccaceae bacterium]
MADAIRDGEDRLPFDPEITADGPRVAFIGHIRSAWEMGTAPKNISSSRDTGEAARIELEPDYARGLKGLEVGRHIIVLYWMHEGQRDLIIQHPRHSDVPRGVFSIRSPRRPNPIAMSTVEITSLDIEAGVIGIDAIDCIDKTPLIDIKPWVSTIDMPVQQDK